MVATSSFKQRFDGLDVTAMVALLQTMLGQRIVNIYDGESSNNHQTYVFKLDGAESTKTFLLIESGVRFHPLPFFAAELPMPSVFCAKLRKHLRGLRLEQISQIGNDRVVLLQFGAGPSKHAILLELYSKGNIILTDADFRILQVLRSHVYSKNGANDGNSSNDKVAVQVGHVYPVTYATTSVAANGNDDNDDDDAKKDKGILKMTPQEVADWAAESVANTNITGTTSTSKKGKKAKQATTNLKTILLKPSSGVSHYGPALLEHCLLYADLPPHDASTMDAMILTDWRKLQHALSDQGPRIMETLTLASNPGYILYEPRHGESPTSAAAVGTPATTTTTAELAHSDKLLHEFLPHLLLQHQDRPHIVYANFGEAVQDFFAHLGAQKRLQKSQVAQTAAQSKLERVKQDQKDRLVALEREQEELQLEAQAIELHAGMVDKALLVVNSALDSGMDWEKLEQLVELEQANGNPIAGLICQLELEKDSITLRLPVTLLDEESVTLDVRISLKETAFANASNLFAKYRALKEKSAKTAESSHKALKAAEETAQRQLAEAEKRTHQAGVSKRKPLWFERFHWFVTSDNYLVIGGRDAQQNELIVKRYLRPGDAYLHADVHGASSCVLRAKRRRLADGKTQQLLVADRALQEAGNFTICRSAAWSSRMVTSAWWVEAHQVSKTAPSGEYLTVGSFMIRGKKNFLPPSQLEMGLAILFRLGDDDSIARHRNERRDLSVMELEDGEENLSGDCEEKTPLNSTSIVERRTPERNVTSTKVEVEYEAFDPLNNTDEISDSVQETDRDSENKTEKKGLSARDRKLIRKYGSLEKSIAKVPGNHSFDHVDDESDAPTFLPENGANGVSHMKRGKKAKAKRANRRYGDQDEEDRELAMMALQGGEKDKRKQKSGRGKGSLPSETQKEVAAETVAVLVGDSGAVADKLDPAVRETLAECVTVQPAEKDLPSTVQWEKFDADTLEQLLALTPVEAQQAAADRLLTLKKTTRVDNFSASLGGILRTIRKYGHHRVNDGDDAQNDKVKRKAKDEKDSESAKWKKTLEAEGVVESDGENDALDDTILLEKLSGKPVPEDLILGAIPVCAPYHSLLAYTYKVKLTPGNLKRGKAAKQCLELFVKRGNEKGSVSAERNKELIKKVGDNEWNQVICADVKIAAPGASKNAKKAKTKKAGTK